MKHSGQAPIGKGEYIREKLEETLPCIWFPMQREERISVVEIPNPEQ